MVWPALTAHCEVWIVCVIEQRSVPVVIELLPLVVEELVLELVLEVALPLELVIVEEVFDVVGDMTLAIVVEDVCFASDVVETVVVEAAALEGAAVEDLAISVDFFSVVDLVAESELVSEGSALFLSSMRSSSSLTSAR